MRRRTTTPSLLKTDNMEGIQREKVSVIWRQSSAWTAMQHEYRNALWVAGTLVIHMVVVANV